jgi:predicted PhzF superfamily epimerase YddE/YHI9
MVSLPYFVVDAFADRPFTGNPAAVVPLVEWLPERLMLSIAAEMNLSETAFFAPEGDGFRLRWFTPTVEVELCGHATVATACVLMTRLEPSRRQVVFASESGPLPVERDGERFVLDFPGRPPVALDDPELLETVTAALGDRPQALLRARDLMAVFGHPDQVRALRPDFGRVAALDYHGVAATAIGDQGYDCVSRFFVPAIGIPEDPVTGAAHCMLAPYWAERLGKPKLSAYQASSRGGEVACEVVGDRVRLGGRAVLVASGTLHV